MPGCWSKLGSGWGGQNNGDGRAAAWKEVDPSMWSVTRRDLKELRTTVQEAIAAGTLKPPPKGDRFHNPVFDDVPLKQWDPSVYKVMDEIIKPHLAKLGTRSSWALDRHPEGAKCDVFATHAWAEGIFEFINAAVDSFPWPAKTMYVCFLANPQDEASLKELLVTNPDDSPFAKALRSAKWFIVIPTKRDCIYKRLWCVYEMFMAQKRINSDGDLKIRIRWIASSWRVLARACCALVMVPIPGLLLAFFVLAPIFGESIGPLMWILTSHLLGSFVWFCIHVFSDTCLQHYHPHEMPECELWLLRAYTYARMALFGIGGGFSTHDLWKNHGHQWKIACHDDQEMRWERGETPSCSLVFCTFVLMYCWDMLTTAIVEIVHQEGGKLNHFNTVSEADCFSADDKEKIQSEIVDKVDEIDEAINDLRVLGKYDHEVLFNLRLGMDREIIRQGVNPWQVVCGVFAWEFWFLTDLFARDDWSGTAVPVITCIIFLFVVYGPSSYKFRALVANEKYIFAIQSFMWVGIAFAVISNHPMFFTCEAVKTFSMSPKTVPLLLALLSLLVSVNLFFYCGLFARCKRVFTRRSSFHDHPLVKAATANVKARYSKIDYGGYTTLPTSG